MALFGSVGLALLSWLKFFAVISHDFALVLVVQSCCAISHIFLSSIPSKLSCWFPKNEEWIISGVNIFCSNGGIIFNFISLMAINCSKTNVSRDLQSFMFIVAALATFLAFVIAFLFKIESPDLPPSYYEALKRDLIIKNDTKSFPTSLKTLLTNKNYVLLAIGFGLQLGIFNGFSTLINSIILHYFPVISKRLSLKCALPKMVFDFAVRSNGGRNYLLHHFCPECFWAFRVRLHFRQV